MALFYYDNQTMEALYRLDMALFYYDNQTMEASSSCGFTGSALI